MNKLSIPSNKEILKILNKLSDFISKYLSILNLKNFKQLYKDFIKDRRFVLTIIIILISIFAHLSTPAFYQDKWVLSKIKNQLEKEFNFNFELPKKVNYSMFPIPSFYLENVNLTKDGRTFGKVNLMKIQLSYNKFFDKDKVNIQNIHVSDSNFEIYNQDIKNLIKFFDKEINNKKLFITNSKVFLKDNNEETYLIFSLNKSHSFFEEYQSKNILNLKGDVFNTPIKVNFFNNYLTKKFESEVNLQDLGKRIKFNLDYLSKKNMSKLELFSGSQSHITIIKFDDNNLDFRSDENNFTKYNYKGNINFKPFYSEVNINYDNLNLSKFIDPNSLFLQIINSEILNNSNLNYKIEIKSKNIKNHRLLKDLILCLSFNQKNFNLDKSEINFDDNVLIKITESQYVANDKENYFSGNIYFKIKNENKIYKFFQTKKNHRKNLDSINIVLKYDFNSSKISIERLGMNDVSNDQIQRIINNFNKKELKSLKRIQLKKFFNEIVSTL